MRETFTPRWFIIKLTGLFFAADSAYNVFIIFRDQRSLTSEGILISAVVALLFGALAVFAWTAEVKKCHVPQGTKNRFHNCFDRDTRA